MNRRSKSFFWKNIGSSVLLIALMISGVSCAGRLAFKKGEEAFREKNWDQSVDQYIKAVQSDPENPRYRMNLAVALIEASNFHVERGEKLMAQKEWKLALLEFQKALDFNAENVRAQSRKSEILAMISVEKKKRVEKTEIEKIKDKASQAAIQRPLLSAASDKPIDLKFASEIEVKEIFSFLQKGSGINLVFDSDFKSKKIAVDLVGVTFKEALDRVTMMSGLFYKVLDEKTIVVIPDNANKRKEYEELILRTFYLSNGDVEKIQAMLRTLAGISVMGTHPDLRAIIIRDSPKKIAIAEKIINLLDKSRAEVVINVEILEVNKSRMREYGIELSNYQLTESLAMSQASSDAGTGAAAASLIRGNMLNNLTASDFLFSLPSINYKLLESDTHSKIIAKPELRVQDGENLTIQVGDKVPAPQTSFVPIAMGGVNQQAITSFQLIEVGIKIEFTPHVHHNGDITLKIKFELSFITAPGTTTIPPTIGTRSVSTVIRMKDGETSLLAGLLRDTERKSQRGFPLLSSIPVLNMLFSGTNEEISQTDIILTIKPRITRMPDIVEEDLAAIWIGTEKDLAIKEPPVRSPFASKEDQGAMVEKKEPGKPMLVIEPSVTEIVPEMEFMKIVSLENVEDVTTIACSLGFDPKVLQVKEIREGTFLNQEGAKTVFVKSFNNATGDIQIGVSRDEFKPGVSGTGKIAEIIFRSIKEGKTTISLPIQSARNSAMKEIPLIILEGNVIVK